MVLLQFTGSASECKMITFNQMFAQPGVKKIYKINKNKIKYGQFAH